MPTLYYRQRVWTKFRSLTTLSVYYWDVESATLTDPWEIAQELSYFLYPVGDWLALFANMISAEAGISRLETKVVAPMGGASFVQGWKQAGLQGQWQGQMAFTTEAARIRWHCQGDVNGRTQVRIGPLGMGAFADGDYLQTFYTVANLFGNYHIATHVTPGGLTIKSCCRNSAGQFLRIERGSLDWPPSGARLRQVRR
jgi:hypothetical protein